MEEDKPLSDTIEESGDQESTELELDGDLFEEGTEDVDADTLALTLAELNELSGRTGDNAFKSKEDYFKHYKNLSSLVGKKEEPKKEVKNDGGNDDIRKEIAELRQTIVEKDFVSENPAAKEHITLIRDVAKSRGVSLSEAYESVKDIVDSASAYKKEREVGVNSKNRINPMQSQRLNKLAQNVKAGDRKSEEALVAEFFKNRG